MKNQLSPQKYIITKARSLTYCECYINEEWQKSGMANIFISKKMPSGNFIIGLYLIDIYCLGLKNTFFQFNLSAMESQEILNKFIDHYKDLSSFDVSSAHNIIYGAIDYAAELGFKPHRDFGITEFILNPDLITDEIDEIEFGKDGMPLFIVGPDDNVKRILGILNQSVGEGNYHYIYSPDMDKDFE